MTRIDATSQLAALIQRQLAALKSPGRLAEAAPSPQQTGGAEAATHESLASLIARRVRMIDPDDPQRGRKAFRVFLESVLLAELGKDLINDAAFYQMVDHIQLEMETDPQLGPAVREAASLLLEGKSG
jgi:hypothetical protein